MPPALHHPDLAAPPMGWSYLRVGSQIRLSPPGNVDGAEGAAIVISPLVARHKGLPSIERVIAAAIDTEGKTRLQVLERSGPMAMKTTTGLAGCCFEVRGEVRGRAMDAGGVIERRVYVMYSDALCYYGINYLAGEAVYEKHLKLFLEAARSVKPFQGRVVTGATEERALHGSYRD
jgi:hypothetical protein